MKRPIVVRGKTVSLGLILMEDAEFGFLLSNDPDVNRYFRRSSNLETFEQTVQSIRDLKERPEKDRVFAIISSDVEKCIGSIGLHDIDWRSGNAHLSYVIAKEFWGKGYTTEAAALLIEYAFVTLNLRKLYTSVFDPNIASKRVLEKNGFKESGRLTKQTYVANLGFVDEVWYELFNDERL